MSLGLDEWLDELNENHASGPGSKIVSLAQNITVTNSGVIASQTGENATTVLKDCEAHDGGIILAQSGGDRNGGGSLTSNYRCIARGRGSKIVARNYLGPRYRGVSRPSGAPRGAINIGCQVAGGGQIIADSSDGGLAVNVQALTTTGSQLLNTSSGHDSKSIAQNIHLTGSSEALLESLDGSSVEVHNVSSHPLEGGVAHMVFASQGPDSRVYVGGIAQKQGSLIQEAGMINSCRHTKLICMLQNDKKRKSLRLQWEGVTNPNDSKALNTTGTFDKMNVKTRRDGLIRGWFVDKTNQATRFELEPCLSYVFNQDGGYFVDVSRTVCSQSK